ncbi:histone deacetylase 5 [Phalaenopsis equestris]|uniref:histone deacetylase 5 n=1 Tax=Phalaenopsis equestris TaxID=78828 RepID=UPI0009E2924C|nr:histone deacetylase 5 [Phalaenopsis equestris]
MDSAPEDRRSPRVGLAYDERMCLHATPDGESHPENPERIRAIWRKLEAEGIPDRCVLLKTKEAEDSIIASVHTKNHIKLIRNISSKAFEFRRLKIASKLNSIYFNEGSSEAAFLAAGTVIEVAENVAKGDLDSAIAVVRPPGHHAEANEAMGFCLFNNVAISASYLLDKRAELGINRILIVDWDVHHGNGTQNMFYRDPRVLYFSVHRFDFGTFYPAGWDGSYCMIGEDQGAGYNINVPWEHGQCGDADYLAVWDHILIPVTEAYNPDIILISAGFDAAVDDPLGGCCVTPYGYSVMLKKLMKFADGKIVLALEGGYNLNSLANSVFACAKTLLEGKPVAGNLEGRPFESTWRVINEVRNELKTYWPVFSVDLPKEILIANAKPYQIQEINSSSDSDVEKDPQPSNAINSFMNNEVGDLISPLSKLNVDEENSGELPALRSQQNLAVPSKGSVCNSYVPWRSSLSKVDVWYGSYGSNMWRPRFLCYLEGGKVEGMNNPCQGAMDKTPPKYITWKSVPHRLFFTRSYTHTWGHGGVAFLNPQSSINEKTFMCLYKITLEQFNDILIQENIANEQFESPFVAPEDIEFIVKNGSLRVESLKGGWYSNVLYLGEQDGIPILTMTCSASDVEQLKSGELPVCAPSKAYENTLLKGLLEEGTRLSTEEAIGYLKDAVTRKL